MSAAGTRFAKRVTLSAVVSVVVLFLPLAYHCSLTMHLSIDRLQLNETHITLNTYKTSKCQIVIGDNRLFNGYIVSFGLFSFILPLLGATVLYVIMLIGLAWRRRITHHARLSVQGTGSSRRRSNAATRVGLRCALITLFYVVCYLPFWFSTLIPLFLSISGNFTISSVYVYLMYVVHSLPYVNSSLNWIFYGLLNSQLRKACSQCRKIKRLRKNTVLQVDAERKASRSSMLSAVRATTPLSPKSSDSRSYLSINGIITQKRELPPFFSASLKRSRAMTVPSKPKRECELLCPFPYETVTSVATNSDKNPGSRKISPDPNQHKLVPGFLKKPGFSDFL